MSDPYYGPSMSTIAKRFAREQRAARRRRRGSTNLSGGLKLSPVPGIASTEASAQPAQTPDSPSKKTAQKVTFPKAQKNTFKKGELPALIKKVEKHLEEQEKKAQEAWAKSSEIKEAFDSKANDSSWKEDAMDFVSGDNSRKLQSEYLRDEVEARRQALERILAAKVELKNISTGKKIVSDPRQAYKKLAQVTAELTAEQKTQLQTSKQLLNKNMAAATAKHQNFVESAKSVGTAIGTGLGVIAAAPAAAASGSALAGGAILLGSAALVGYSTKSLLDWGHAYLGGDVKTELSAQANNAIDAVVNAPTFAAGGIAYKALAPFSKLFAASVSGATAGAVNETTTYTKELATDDSPRTSSKALTDIGISAATGGLSGPLGYRASLSPNLIRPLIVESGGEGLLAAGEEYLKTGHISPTTVIQGIAGNVAGHTSPRIRVGKKAAHGTTKANTPKLEHSKPQKVNPSTFKHAAFKTNEFKNLNAGLKQGDPYKALGIKPNASEIEIEQAFKKAKNKLHSDRWKRDDDKPLNQEQERLLNDAFSAAKQANEAIKFSRNNPAINRSNLPDTLRHMENNPFFDIPRKSK